jgi:steroid delta-isomerase-like uncharacterized protein
MRQCGWQDWAFFGQGSTIMTAQKPSDASGGPADSGQGSADLARALFAAIGRHDLDAVRALDAPDVVDDFVAIGVFSGVDAVIGFFAELFAAVPDFRIDVLNVTAEGDTAVVQWHATGTFSGGPFQGIHATGRSVDLRGCDVMRFEDGLLKHNTIYYDGLAFARQIGLLPTEGSRADRALQTVFNARTDTLARVSGLRR